MRWDLRPELAEAAGTCVMMLAGGAAIMTAWSEPLVASAFGGAIMVMIYALGHVCGAHFNPAITLAFAATGHFPWHRVPTYVAAQLAGAFLACMALLHLGPIEPVVPAGTEVSVAALVIEALATAVLAFVVIAVATDPRAAPAVPGLAIGATVFLGALVAGPLTGAAMNPARALAPALVAGHPSVVILHVLGPLGGGIVGMFGYEILRRGARPQAGATMGAAGPVNLEAA